MGNVASAVAVAVAVAWPKKSMMGAEQPTRTTRTWLKTLMTFSADDRDRCLFFLPFIDFHQVTSV